MPPPEKVVMQGDEDRDANIASARILQTAIQTIAHPTDFSDSSADAFAHVLRMALDTKSHLYLLHVREPGSPGAWTSFPHVRDLLASWGLMGLHEAPSQIEAKLGIRVTKVEIQHENPMSGLFEFILSHRPDLIVLATHGREGLNRWLRGSVSEELARRTHIPTLFLGPNAQGFVDIATGDMRLERVLIPVAHQPSPLRALNILTDLLAPFGVSPEAFRFLHIGDDPPKITAASGAMCLHDVEVAEGPVVETILGVAQDKRADMIVMPTAGREGFLDALRGSTTEQVLRQAPCPLLAIRATEPGLV
jgi:nucleotide-binding universal stress UspA family protein